MNRLAFVIALLFNTMYVSATDDIITTALDDIIAEDKLTTCTDKLLEIGNDLIGVKKHRLMNTSHEDTETVSISGVLNYNDRISHLDFALHKTKLNQCQISYRLSYHLEVACLQAREEVFKKWPRLGKLTDSTYVYKHKRDARKTAYLSDTNRGLGCLVSIHYIELSDAKTKK